MYVVYMLQCGDGTYYTGITNRLEERLRLHQLGKGAKYTRARLPVTLVYQEPAADKSQALRRELEIKSWTRERKRRFINGE
jgi:putative endonuclease